MSDETRCLGNDGVAELWTPRAGDAQTLIAGRDAAFRRWLGAGSDAPEPTACIRAGDRGEDGTRPVVGWIDYDTSPAWLRPGEANVGYNVFAGARGQGYATRALQLLVHHLAVRGEVRTAVLLIDPENRDSQRVAARAAFARDGVVRLRDDDLDGQWRYVRDVPALECDVEGVRIRAPRDGDLTMDLEAKDREQMRWLWTQADVDAWAAMSPGAREAHALAGLRRNARAFATGPKWAFSIDCDGAECVGHIDADLANPRVPAGEANIAYAVHPAWRRRGIAKRAVRAVIAFLREHTATRVAHLLVDEANVASAGVARRIGQEAERFEDEHGRRWIRWLIAVR